MQQSGFAGFFSNQVNDGCEREVHGLKASETLYCHPSHSYIFKLSSLKPPFESLWLALVGLFAGQQFQAFKPIETFTITMGHRKHQRMLRLKLTPIKQQLTLILAWEGEGGLPCKKYGGARGKF